jgi:hypothetical protein
MAGAAMTTQRAGQLEEGSETCQRGALIVIRGQLGGQGKERDRDQGLQSICEHKRQGHIDQKGRLAFPGGADQSMTKLNPKGMANHNRNGRRLPQRVLQAVTQDADDRVVDRIPGRSPKISAVRATSVR